VACNCFSTGSLARFALCLSGDISETGRDAPPKTRLDAWEFAAKSKTARRFVTLGPPRGCGTVRGGRRGGGGPPGARNGPRRPPFAPGARQVAMIRRSPATRREEIHPAERLSPSSSRHPVACSRSSRWRQVPPWGFPLGHRGL
jgi:hypothetical protein